MLRALALFGFLTEVHRAKLTILHTARYKIIFTKFLKWLGIHNSFLSAESLLHLSRDCKTAKQRILHYNATIRPLLNYVNASWLERSSKDNIQRLFRYQKRVSRLSWMLVCKRLPSNFLICSIGSHFIRKQQLPSARWHIKDLTVNYLNILWTR